MAQLEPPRLAHSYDQGMLRLAGEVRVNGHLISLQLGFDCNLMVIVVAQGRVNLPQGQVRIVGMKLRDIPAIRPHDSDELRDLDPVSDELRAATAIGLDMA